jgi:hypothetical protein
MVLDTGDTKHNYTFKVNIIDHKKIILKYSRNSFGLYDFLKVNIALGKLS